MNINADIAGTRIVELEVGKAYGRIDKPGAYVIMQFETSETVVVKEVVSEAIEIIPIETINLLRQYAANERPDLLVLTPEEIAETTRKFKSIESYIDQKSVRAEIADKAAKEAGVSRKTWLEWLRRFRRNPVKSSLLRRRRDDIGKSRLQPEVEKLVVKHLNLLKSDGNLTVTEAHGDLKHDIDKYNRSHDGERLEVPALNTLITRWRQYSELEKAKGRDGNRLAEIRHGLDRGSIQGADYPLAIVQADHTPLPIVVVDEEFRQPIGRPYITVLIDINSRMLPGFYLTLEAPGNLSLGLALTHAILPKDDTLKLVGELKAEWPISGFMRVLHADSAGEFQGNMMELACAEYRIDLQFRRLKNPKYGAHIEAYLGSLSKALRRLPGSKRGGPDEMGDTIAEEYATMTMAELERWIISLVIEYHVTPHSGLNGMTPLAKFREGMRGTGISYPVGKVRRAMDPAKLRLDLLPVEERVISPKGVQIEYLHYYDDCLQRWVNAVDPDNPKESRKFLFRSDPRDLTVIYFLEPDSKRYRPIRLRNLTRPSISRWEYNAVRKFLEERGAKDIDEDLIFEAKELRLKIMEESKAKTNVAQRRKDAERGRRAQDAHTKQHEEVTRDEDPKPPPRPVETAVAPDDVVAYEENWE